MGPILGKKLVEGDEGTIVGLNAILSHAGVELQVKLETDMVSKLELLDEFNGGNFAVKNELWHHGLTSKSTWDEVTAQANKTLMVATKEQRELLNVRLAEAVAAFIREARKSTSSPGVLPPGIVIPEGYRLPPDPPGTSKYTGAVPAPTGIP
jgi:hypothetical protein